MLQRRFLYIFSPLQRFFCLLYRIVIVSSSAKVVKNHELCKSLLYFLRVILLHVLNIGLLFGK